MWRGWEMSKMALYAGHVVLRSPYIVVLSNLRLALVEQDREAAAKAARVEHEFTAGEEQTLRICIDAMHTAGLALGVQGIATSLLGAAKRLSTPAC